MSNEQHGIRIVTIAGSVRPGNFTSKALALVNAELRGHEGVIVETVDPAELTLAPPGLPPTEDSKRLQAMVNGATGLVFATPEYHGSFGSVIQLVIENLGFPSVISNKPVALLGVAAGQIGAVQSLGALRGVVSHVGGLVLPGSVSVAGVQEAFAANGTCNDPKVEERIRGLATALIDFIRGAACPRVCLESMPSRRALSGSPPRSATQSARAPHEG